MLSVHMAEVVILRQQLVVYVLHFEKVVNLVFRIDCCASVAVPADMGL
jgi:hypothetical protein